MNPKTIVLVALAGLHRNHGAKHLDFDNAESQKVTQEDHDSACADLVR